jgi:hypothetical protein
MVSETNKPLAEAEPPAAYLGIEGKRGPVHSSAVAPWRVDRFCTEPSPACSSPWLAHRHVLLLVAGPEKSVSACDAL